MYVPGGIVGVVTDLYRKYVSGRGDRIPVTDETDDAAEELGELTASGDDALTSGAKP